MFRFPERRQSIRSLSRLADSEHKSAIFKHWIPVPKFRGVLNFYRYTGKFFNHVLTQESRMPTCTTSCDHNALYTA